MSTATSAAGRASTRAVEVTVWVAFDVCSNGRYRKHNNKCKLLLQGNTFWPGVGRVKRCSARAGVGRVKRCSARACVHLRSFAPFAWTKKRVYHKLAGVAVKNDGVCNGAPAT
jgi:hypothetical protein